MNSRLPQDYYRVTVYHRPFPIRKANPELAKIAATADVLEILVGYFELEPQVGGPFIYRGILQTGRKKTLFHNSFPIHVIQGAYILTPHWLYQILRVPKFGMS